MATKETVTPLEHRAMFSIDTEDGYIRIDQSVGNPALYTPEEARDIAEDILDAVEDAERE